ncbi:unnamed protein product [Discula destructiva]
MTDTSKPTEQRPRYVFFFTGPTACGKSTIAKYVADRLNFSFLEGDDFHAKANVEKMHRGEPLTDDDRRGWLHALRDHENEHPAGGKAGEKTRHLVITCSALKRQYRDILREGSEQSSSLRIRFVFLDAPEGVLRKRAKARKGHFAGEVLVHSQFLTLEIPGEDEADVVRVSVDRELEEVEEATVRRVQEVLDGDQV